MRDTYIFVHRMNVVKIMISILSLAFCVVKLQAIYSCMRTG